MPGRRDVAGKVTAAMQVPVIFLSRDACADAFALTVVCHLLALLNRIDSLPHGRASGSGHGCCCS